MTGYRICSRCIMDTSAPEISFDAEERCNFCSEFLKRMAAGGGFFEKKRQELPGLIAAIKQQGRGKPYDCIVGVSGGVDSSYALYLAKQQGLRPLAVHLDNGWNSELAVKNIESLIRKLDVDLHTHVIEWRENRDLQISFFKAGVIDIELLMDNAMLKLNYEQAADRGVHHILAGTNQATEGIRMPASWNHFKLDAVNIRAIQRRFGTRPIRTHPLMGVTDFLRFKYAAKVEWLSFLDYVNYDKQAALDVLVQEIGYRPYPYKHYESVFTRFYQGYILIRKFGVDKRRVHLSTLICSGQMSREAALEKVAEPAYPDPVQLATDRAFVLKKLGFSEAWFEDYLAAPGEPHAAFPSTRKAYDLLISLNRRLRR